MQRFVLRGIAVALPLWAPAFAGVTVVAGRSDGGCSLEWRWLCKGLVEGVEIFSGGWANFSGVGFAVFSEGYGCVVLAVRAGLKPAPTRFACPP